MTEEMAIVRSPIPVRSWATSTPGTGPNAVAKRLSAASSEYLPSPPIVARARSQAVAAGAGVVDDDALAAGGSVLVTGVPGAVGDVAGVTEAHDAITRAISADVTARRISATGAADRPLLIPHLPD